MNNVWLSIRFGLLFLFIIVQFREGYAQSVAPLIDSPGKTIGSDFNGDGIHDIIVGAPQNNDGGSDDEGAAYIFFGANNLSGTQSLGAVQSADVTFLGKNIDDNLGIGVSSAGDVNGDGIHDVIVGADGYDTEGAAYIFLGATNLSGTKVLGGIQSADVTIIGLANGDILGRSVSAAGDVNGDGFDDVIVGAYGADDGGGGRGAAYIFFGAGDLSGTKRLAGVQSAAVTILGKGNNDFLGRSVSGAGDVNGDGLDDVIVGASLNEDGGANAGAAYVFFGALNISGTKTAGTDQDVEILGKTGSDQLGEAVSGAGDINGDGFDDLIVGAFLNDEGTGDNAGAVYIFFGASGLTGTKALGGGESADATFLGKADTDGMGLAVSGAGDVNEDGLEDILIGSYRNDDCPVVTDCGATYVIFGASSLSGTQDFGGGQSADATVLGKGASDRLGRSVSGIGDVNADGIQDIHVGAYRNQDVGVQTGAAYIFFGATDLSGTKTAGTDQDVEILGKAATDLLGRSVGGGQNTSGP